MQQQNSSDVFFPARTCLKTGLNILSWVYISPYKFSFNLIGQCSCSATTEESTTCWGEAYGGVSSPEKDGGSLQLQILTGSLVCPQENHEPLLLGDYCCFNISDPNLDLGLGGLCACLATNWGPSATSSGLPTTWCQLTTCHQMLEMAGDLTLLDGALDGEKHFWV